MSPQWDLFGAVMVVSSLSPVWGHAVLVVVLGTWSCFPCLWVGDPVMSPLSLGWGHDGIVLVMGLGSWWCYLCHCAGYYGGVTLVTSCHWVGDLVPLSLSLNLEQSGAILVTRLGSWQCHLCQCVGDMVVSSLSLCWFHGGVILVTSCHQVGNMVVSPLSLD